MNITRLTVKEAIDLLQSPCVEEHYAQAGARFAGERPHTINLFRYVAWLLIGKPAPTGRKRSVAPEDRRLRKKDADLARVNAVTRAANDIGEIPFHTINWVRRFGG